MRHPTYRPLATGWENKFQIRAQRASCGDVTWRGRRSAGMGSNGKRDVAERRRREESPQFRRNVGTRPVVRSLAVVVKAERVCYVKCKVFGPVSERLLQATRRNCSRKLPPRRVALPN